MKNSRKKKVTTPKKFLFFSFKQKSKGAAQPGLLYAGAIMTLAILGGAVAVAGVLPATQDPSLNPPPNNYTCCDTGDGASCRPRTERSLTYNGQVYALLKSNIAQNDAYHIVPTDQFAPTGERIFINDSNRTANYNRPGCEHGKDLIDMTAAKRAGKFPQPCFGIPNEMLVYICKDTPQKCNQQRIENGTAFDAYYRVADGPVPNELSTLCNKPKGSTGLSEQKIVGLPTPGGRKNLQLETFLIEQNKEPMEWLGSWCKPAIYLYPPKRSSVHVQVAPQGDFTLTIPEYPQGGWLVTANPDGLISYKNQTFPYLYWEAKIPDALIQEPKEGYVVAYDELPTFFQRLLPQTGLIQKESQEFSEYWLKALPTSPYYFVGFMPQSQINRLAPLTIEPKPDSILRVSLYFKALDEKKNVTPPQLSPFERKGFTVTEWGGLFKSDKKHQGFTCMI